RGADRAPLHAGRGRANAPRGRAQRRPRRALREGLGAAAAAATDARADHRPAPGAAQGSRSARLRPPARDQREEALKLLVLTSSYPTPEAPVAGIFVREYAQVAARSAEVEIAHLERGGAPRIRVERQQGEELPTLRV